ncbi:MAG TPA: type II/IV secretion system protein [Candidatus Hydrogenedentes bacterium]|nr:type II/IV secretion system protein [Candidatus Hydrogenedentota bacterium]
MGREEAFEVQLVREGLLDAAQLDRARTEATRRGISLAEAVSELGYAAVGDVYRALAAACGLDYVEPSKIAVPDEALAHVPARFATHYAFVPVAEHNGALVVAVSDPLNAQLLDDVRVVLKRRIEPVVATPNEIARATKNLYGVGADTMERILIESEAAGERVSLDLSATTTDLGDDKLDASIIKFVNEVLSEAIRAGATDVHIEPFEDELRVRYRIDGFLHETPTPASIRAFQPAIVSRVKIMANLNIAEKRVPQDGKILARLGSDEYDLRVSVLPTPHGETLDIRILSRSSTALGLDELGFLPDDLALFSGLLERPHGIILVTGPTGSGKTTTLYAALSILNRIDLKIITIEEPIEYQLKGITQMQVMPRIGFGFASGLRHMLRHDPDIMMVGEIRDYETAEMAVRASLTGHLVFSTLHTNDAAGTVSRLIDIGVEPFLISGTMIAAMAQRLVRRVCEHCAEAYEPEPEALRDLGVAPGAPADARFRRGKGCERCLHTGYKGRIALFEILPFSNPIKELTVQRAAAMEIQRKARQLGVRTLRESGWIRVCQGITTIEEVLRVTAAADPIEAGEAGAPV